MTRERLWQVCRSIALHDEDLLDVSGLSEEKERCRRALCSSHVVEGGGDALQGISFSEGDRSSPVQSERFRAGGRPSQC
jgi:hypothetical protein